MKRHVNKYTDLVKEVKEAGNYSPELIMGSSRGPCYSIGFDDLKAYLSTPTKERDTLILCIMRTVLVESHKIWTMHNWWDSDSLQQTSNIMDYIMYNVCVMSATARYSNCAML